MKKNKHINVMVHVGNKFFKKSGLFSLLLYQTSVFILNAGDPSQTTFFFIASAISRHHVGPGAEGGY
jgi:hypothetical protein